MNTIKIFTAVFLLLLLGYAAITYAANRKVERQKYRLVKTLNGIEIRYYSRAIMATVTTKGETYMGNSNSNFRTLAGYIFGGNKSSQKIAMTAPVHIDKDTAGSRMSFVMPSDYDMSKLPVPNDSKVDLHYSQEGYFAVLKFGGFANEHKIRHRIAELKATIAALGFNSTGDYSFLGYNAPWDIVGRENEIIVPISYTE